MWTGAELSTYGGNNDFDYANFTKLARWQKLV